MEQGYEFTLTTMRRMVLAQKDNNELYIPSQGKHTTNSEEEPFDLAEKLIQFFVFDDTNPSDPRVMLLMGDTGSGKSMFSQQFHQQLWEAYKSGDPIPLWIPLPELENPFESAVEEVLKKYGLNDVQISEMKAKERFIFIVDGYDELHRFQNCYVTNKWDKWNTKVLITCRAQALYYQKDPDKYFVPFSGEKRLPWLLRKLYVAPFSLDQIKAYVEAYNQRNQQINLEDFDKIPGLEELITTPFLLHLTVESLPDILANLGVEEENPKMMQAKLYDVFIGRWFNRQIIKLQTAGQLIDDPIKMKERFWDYCKRLALEMHAKEESVIPYIQQKVGGRLFGKQEKENIWAPFFSEETEILRSACPLKRMGDHHYGFIHASMVEYFATRAMYEEIQEQEATEELPNEDKEKEEIGQESEMTEKKPPGGIYYRVFAKEPNGIRNLADRIKMNEGFKRKLLRIVERSKVKEEYAIGAANAITALVRAGVTFNGADLSNIKISGADLSGGYFDQANLSNSDISDVYMYHTWLRGARLDDSNLKEINFGEYPYFYHEAIREIYHHRYEEPVTSFDFRPDLNLLASAWDGSIYYWDLRTYQKLDKVNSRHCMEITTLQISLNGKRVAFGTVDSKVYLVPLFFKDSGDGSYMLEGHESPVTCVTFSHDSNKLASCSGTPKPGGDCSVRVWDVSCPQNPMILTGHNSLVSSISFSRDNILLASSSLDQTVRIWEVSTGKLLNIIEGFSSGVVSVQFSPDDKKIAVGCWNGEIQIILLSDLSSILRFHEHEKFVSSLSFSPNGVELVSGSADRTVRIWDTGSKRSISILYGHEGTVFKVQYCDDGNRVVSCGDKTVRIWDVQREQFWDVQRDQFKLNTHEHIKCFNATEISPDKKLFASGDRDKIIKIWNISSGVLSSILSTDNIITCLAFSPSCKELVSGSYKTIRLWDLEKSREIAVFKGHTTLVLKVAFNIDGTEFFSAGQDGTIYIWSVSSRQIKAQYNSVCNDVRNISFSTLDMKILSIGVDSSHIWEIGREDKFCELQDSSHHLSNEGAISRDGQLIATGGKHCEVKIWDSRDGKKLSEHKEHIDSVVCVAFNSNGSHVFSLGSTIDNTFIIWDINKHKSIFHLKFHTEARHFSYHFDGMLIFVFKDGSIQYWENLGNETQYVWQLRWSTNLVSRLLNLENVHASNVRGLGFNNNLLLTSRGAVVELNPEFNENQALDQIGVGNYHAAIEYFDEAVLAASVKDCSISLDKFDYVEKRALCKLGFGNFRAALTDFDQAISELNIYEETDALEMMYLGRAIGKAELGYFAEALQDFNLANKQVVFLQDYVKMIPSLEEFDEEDENCYVYNPILTTTLMYRGLCKAKSGQVSEAIEDYEAAIAYSQHLSAILELPWSTQANVSFYSYPVLSFDKKILLQTKRAVLQGLCGVSYILNKSFEKAMNCFITALDAANSSQNNEVIFFIKPYQALVFFLQGKIKESQEYIKEIYECIEALKHEEITPLVCEKSTPVCELVQGLLCHSYGQENEGNQIFEKLFKGFKDSNNCFFKELKIFQGLGLLYLENKSLAEGKPLGILTIVGRNTHSPIHQSPRDMGDNCDNTLFKTEFCEGK